MRGMLFGGKRFDRTSTQDGVGLVELVRAALETQAIAERNGYVN